MGTQVTLNLPDNTFERATKYAAYAHRDVSEIIAAALASSLPSLDAIDQLRGIAKLPDEEIVALAGLRMEREADLRLSALLDRKQAGALTDLDRAELAALMRAYEMGLLRQSQGSGRSGASGAQTTTRSMTSRRVSEALVGRIRTGARTVVR